MPQPINYSDTTPAADTGYKLAKWKADAPGADNVVRNVSVEVPIATPTVAGLVPNPPNNAAKVLLGDGTFGDAPVAAGSVTETALNLSDVTTDNVSSSKHGFAPKLPNDATKFLDGTGVYSTPAGGGGGSTGGGGETPADLSTWQNVNQAAGTLSGSGSVTGLLEMSSSAVLLIVKPTGGSSWSLQFKLEILNSNWSSGNVGLTLWDQGANKFSFFFVYFPDGNTYLQHYTGTTFNGTVVSGVQGQATAGQPKFFKASCDGVTITYQISNDGDNWFTITTEAVGTFFTPSHFGFTGGGNSGLFKATLFNLPTASGGGIVIDTPGLGYVTPGWNPSDSTMVQAGQIVGSGNQVLVTQFVLRDSVVVKHITFQVTAGGGHSALGIYDTAGNKLVAADNVDTSATGTKRISVTPTTLTPGIYYFAQCADGTTVNMNVIETAANFTLLLNAGIIVRQGSAANAMSSGVLPSTLGALSAAQVYPVMSILEA